MQITITAKKLDLTPAIRSYAEEKIGRLDKFMDGIMEAHVLLRVEKHRHIAEATLHARNADFTGKENNEDLYAAIDRLADKIEKQVKKYKTKNITRRRRSKSTAEDIFDIGSIMILGGDEREYSEESRPVVKEKIIHLDRLRPEEAISRMEVHGDNFWVFTDVEFDQMCVVYRRKDGTYGLIQPRD